MADDRSCDVKGPGRAGMAGWLPTMPAIAAGIAMFAWSYGTWPDVLIDFGRELYTPWRITQGQVLHRDIANIYGPLSSYVNAFWFTLFGTSLQTLALCNLAILAGMTALLYGMIRAAAGAWSAAACGAAVMTLFGFSQFAGAGNYNLICPYSHEMTHGLLLGLGAIAMLARHARTRSRIDLALAGLLTGLVFLTKIEPFVAVAAAMAAGLTASLSRAPSGTAGRTASLALFAAMAVLPPLASFGLFATAMPASEALKATLGSWVFVGDPQLRALPFFRVWAGTQDLSASAAVIARMSGLWAAVFGPALLVAWASRASTRTARWKIHALAAAIWAVALIWTIRSPQWLEAFRPLPFVLLAAIIVAIMRCRQASRGDAATGDPERAKAALRLMLLVFAAAMLLKMLFNARIRHYGFALALPGVTMLIALLLDWIPAWLSARGRDGRLFRAAACGVLLVLPLPYLRIMDSWIGHGLAAVGSGADEFLADPDRGEAVAAALDGLGRIASPGDSMAVMPEGVMLNYLSRLPSTSPYLTFLPPDLLMFGERRMLDSLAAAPPAFVLLVHRNTSEYGAEYFGRDYGQAIFHWVAANYRPVGQVGAAPFQPDHRFGIIVLQRNDIAPARP